jgi:iron complex transport system substrate-binding protein
MHLRIGRIKKPLGHLTWALFICIIISGCQGRPIRQQAEYPRIISLAPSITEILFALELEKNVVGITTCCNYPKGTKRIEKIATFSGQANLERILEKEADLVFSTGLEQSPIIQKLKSLKINVILIYPDNLDELMDAIIKIGKLTNRRFQARKLVSRMQARIEKVAAKAQAIPDKQRPKVFVEISASPLMTAGCGSLIDELIKIAGGKNIAYDTERPYSQFSPELVATRNPDFILLGYMQTGSQRSILNRSGWGEINAIKNRRIIADIKPDILLRPGPRIVQGLEQIQQHLYERRK